VAASAPSALASRLDGDECVAEAVWRGPGTYGRMSLNEGLSAQCELQSCAASVLLRVGNPWGKRAVSGDPDPQPMAGITFGLTSLPADTA
jgi:hypothetical protein